MAIAALDLGRRRIGVAIAEDAGSSTAYPVGTIERRSWSHDLEAIRTLLRSRDVRRIVVGLPLNMDGSVGAQAHAAQEFARRLEVALVLPVSLYDERLTSFEAEQRLRESSRKTRHSKAAVDAVAAAIILEGWLRASRPSR